MQVVVRGIDGLGNQLFRYAALRYYAMGERSYDGAASEDEVELMRDVFRECMRSGAIGLSSRVGTAARP